MQFCNLCAKNSGQVKQISEHKVTSGNYLKKIKVLLNIFRNDIVKFLLEEKDTLICNNCLKKLKKCYEFVQQIKESENKLNRGKEIKTEHDYFETICNDNRNKKFNVKITDTKESLKTQDNSEVIKPKLNFKPILPKTTAKRDICKQQEKFLEVKTRLYKCLQCAESFKSFKLLSEHEKEFCKNKFVKDLKICAYCHKSFSKESFLSEHVSLKHPQGEFMCCLCQDRVFTAKGYLARHIEKVHNHKSLQYFCGECEKSQCMHLLEELREHFLQKHPIELTKTASEDQTGNNLSDEDMDLEMHEEFLDEFLLTHSNENSFQFSECWEALDLHLPDMLQANASSLNNVHEFTQAFSCPKCFEQFKYPQPLLKHLAEIHSLPVLICRFCSKCFISFKDLKLHKLQTCVNISKLSPKLECPYCSKSFKNASNLKQHLRIVHCQLKRHICQLCDKQFSTLDHLKKHVLSQHQNERKHLCTVCDKSFTQLGHLKQHLAIHSKNKTVQCSNCPLTFWRKIDLIKHCQKKHSSSSNEAQ